VHLIERDRLRSPELLVEEIWQLKNMGIHNIHMYADLFTVNRQQVVELCELMIAERINIKWTCNSRVDYVDEEMLQLMGKAGNWLISWGIESGNEQILLRSALGIYNAADDGDVNVVTEETKPYADLRKKVLSHHKEIGMEDAFRYSAEDDEYYETAEYEMSSPHMAMIDEFSEISFWDTLATKLAQRDLAAQEAIGTAEPLPPEERVTKLWEIEERYQEELSENGLANIRIDTKPGLH